MDGQADEHPTRLTATALHEALAAQPSDAMAEQVAERLRAEIGEAVLAKGIAPLVDELTVAWAIAAPEAQSAPLIVAEGTAGFRRPLARLGRSEVYALTLTLDDGTALRWAYEVDGTRRHAGELEVYRVHPDSRPRPGVPRGALLPQGQWRSEIFAGTVRDWWLYVPAQYDGRTPACAMIFQDGGRFYKDDVPTVFDNLIAQGDMPLTLGIFLDPGRYADTTVSNRSFEYDTLSDQYARFLLHEILPEVEQRYLLRADAGSRAIAGLSSGAICAFTAAWQRPDQFGKVLSWIGSFANIAAGPTLRDGGHNYPALVRRVPRKPIRVFLQGGANDLDCEYGNWPLANQEMAAALAFAGYDYRFVYGQGFHSPLHGRAIMPDALRWLWRPHEP